MRSSLLRPTLVGDFRIGDTVMLLLIPLGLFWTLAAIYLGGMSVDLAGGSGLRQVLGLLLSFVLFVVVWWALTLALGGMGLLFGVLVLPTLMAVLLMPVIVRVGMMIFGVKVHRVSPAH